MRFLETYWQKHFAKFVVICYWILGTCNNFAYVVMLSAAHDLLEDHSKNDTSNSTTTTTTSPFTTTTTSLMPTTTASNHTNKFDCNEISTGAILLADILPGIVVKVLAPFFVHRIKYSYRIASVVVANVLSFSMVALAPGEHPWLIFLGVCMASFGSSFGEITFLSLSTLYPRMLSITGWSSGTGAAGVGGSFGYAFLTQIGLSPKVTLLSMLIIPVIMAVSYLFLPDHRFSQYYNDIETNTETNNTNSNGGDSPTPINNEIDNKAPLIPSSEPTTKSRIREFFALLRVLSKYMIPLFLVYFAEYFINQGLFELAYFKDDPVFKDHKSQYRWYSVAYQLAVFISRSSIRWIKIKYLAIFPIFQLLNVGIFLSHLFLGYIPSIWILFGVILWEGLLGGGCYVNAFFMVSNDIPKEKREFSIAVTSIADTFGIALAGFTAIPVHNAICKYGES